MEASCLLPESRLKVHPKKVKNNYIGNVLNALGTKLYMRGCKPRFWRFSAVFSALLSNDNKVSLLASKPQDLENDSSQNQQKPPQNADYVNVFSGKHVQLSIILFILIILSTIQLP